MITPPTIHLGGEARPIKFGMNAMSIFCRDTGLTLNEMFTISANMRLDHIIALTHAGLIDGARVAKSEFSASKEEVADWLDEAGMEALAEVMQLFAEAITKIAESSSDKKKQSQEKGKQ